MDVAALFSSRIALLLVGGLGLYLALPQQTEAWPQAARRAGLALAAAVVVLLAVRGAVPADEESGSYLAAVGPALLFYALAGGAVAAAAVVVVSQSLRRVVAGFVAVGLLVGALVMFPGAAALGLVSISVSVAAAVMAAVVRNSPARRLLTEDRDRHGREPLLACLAGALLAAALIGTIRQAYNVEARRTAAAGAGWETGARATALPRWPPVEPGRRDLPLLGQSLTLAAVLFALGVIGFLTRREPLAVVLSAGLMAQGVMLSLAAFGGFHHDVAGPLFGLLVLATVAAYGVMAVMVSAVRRGPETFDRDGSVEAVAPAVPEADAVPAGGAHG